MTIFFGGEAGRFGGGGGVGSFYPSDTLDRTLSNMLHELEVVLTFESVDNILKCGPIQMQATEQYFPVLLFIMLYKVGLTFESVDGILKCDHSNGSY